MRRFRKILILCGLAGLLILPRLGETCGPFFNEAVFTRMHGPDGPMADFAQGKIGVVLPDWHAAYRVVAYRYLEGRPLSAAEQQSLLAHYDADRRIAPAGQAEDPSAGWMSARAQFSQGPAPAAPGENKGIPNAFNSYPNCLGSAYTTAVATLKDRASRFSPASPELQEWIRGQDAVFSNCTGAGSIPAELPASANPLLRSDRAYQIAAAHFYAGTPKDYEAALLGFQAIAADKSSPWHSYAPYLVARTMIRQASATAAENQTSNPVLLDQAETQLEAVLKDPEQQSLHGAAQSLLDLVQLRLHPDQRQAELGKLLAAGGTGAAFGQNLVDYTWQGAPFQASDDLSVWMAGGGKNKDAIAEWKESRSIPWLVAALWQLTPKDAAFAEVMEAAARVPATSTAFPTVAYFRVLLARESGNDELARQILKAAVAQSKNWPQSAVHLFEDQQMLVATDFHVFQSHLWQRPIGYEDVDGGLEPCEKPACTPLFSPLAARVLNTRTPADLFARVALSNTLPANLRGRMAPSAWARAALLDQAGLATQVSYAAAVAQPALKPYLQQYTEAKTPEERKFAAVFAILHFPGLRPSVDSTFPRTTEFGRLDDYRDNWWCQDIVGNLVSEVNRAKPIMADQHPTQKPADAPFPDFLSAAERERASGEWHHLESYGSAPLYLPRIVIEWAKKHPDDTRVPEALHLAVRATRYGCDDVVKNPYSHEAFNLLHHNYPKSEWAKKTPFWF